MIEPFRQRYAEAAQNLLGPLPANAGIAEQVIAAAEQRLAVRLPAALRDYYLALGGHRELNEAHNRLVAPADWSVEDGKLVFLDENQSVVLWGVEASPVPEADPPVFQIQNCQGEQWEEECGRCSEFLLVMLHWQAVAGALEYSGMAEETGDKLTEYLEAKWERVGAIHEMTAFRRPGQAACLMEEGGELYVGALDEAGFEQIAAELGEFGVEVDQLLQT